MEVEYLHRDSSTKLQDALHARRATTEREIRDQTATHRQIDGPGLPDGSLNADPGCCTGLAFASMTEYGGSQIYIPCHPDRRRIAMRTDTAVEYCLDLASTAPAVARRP